METNGTLEVKVIRRRKGERKLRKRGIYVLSNKLREN